MKTVTIVSTWRASISVEVEDDVDIRDDNFSDWPDDVLDQVDSQVAELVDWEVTG